MKMLVDRLCRWAVFVATTSLLTAPAIATDSPAKQHGIDVSHHSGAVDWGVVAEHGLGFVYLKATEGIDDADPQYLSHHLAVGELGVPRGAYHFFVSEDDPDEQARFFLSQARFETGDLVPVVDVEVLGHGTSGDLNDRLRRILRILESTVGAKPMIYTNARFWDAHFAPDFGDYPLWIAEYEVDTPTLPAGWKEWSLWQFEGDATMPGIEKGADRSRLREGLDIESLRIPQPAHVEGK